MADKIQAHSGDSAWQTMQIPYTTGEIRYIKRDGVVTIVGRDLSVPEGAYQPMGSLPTGYRPALSSVVGQLIYTDAASVCGYVSITNSGPVIISNRYGSAMTHIYFIVSYPVL